MFKIKKIFDYTFKTASVLLVLLLAVGSFSVCALTKTSGISEITVATGEQGRTNLESSGYSVLFQGMNLVSNEDSMVFLGYKKGSQAITDLVVSTRLDDFVTYKGIKYQSVSSVSLNNGTDGTPLYLYYTKDSSAGNEIVSLDTVSGFTDADDVVSLRNDGSAPVRTDDGTLANLDSGIENSEIYLLMYKSAKVKRYISDVCVVTGDSKAEAVNLAASSGCDYYLDNNIKTGNKFSYIAFQRTANANEAITSFEISDSKVKLERDENSTAHLLDITFGRLFKESFELGNWAGVYASYDKSVSRSSDEYKTLLNSKESCSCVFAGNPNIYAIYEGNAEASGVEPETQVEPSASATDAEETDAVDEIFNIEKTEETVEQTTESTDGDAVASVVNNGNGIVISCVLIILILVIVIAGIYIKSRKKNSKKQK